VIHTFEEIVLTYRSEQYDAWTRGDRSLIPRFHPTHDIVVNQPRYHFGEFLTLDHFHRTEGWLGFRFFALGVIADLKHPRYAPGGAMIRRMIPANRLESFLHARSTDPREYRSAKGEPDLFLYKLNGEVLFLEVKKGQDSPDKERYQLRCLAQIRSILGCRAEIVYVREERQQYAPRTYAVELE
jgi:hypothetical protein